MSLHAAPDPEVLRRLEVQRRRSTLGSITLSLFLLGGVAALLAFVILPALDETRPMVVAYTQPAPLTEEPQPKIKQFSKQPQAPSASASAMKVIASASAAPVALEVPEFHEEFAGFSGAGDDFDEGWAGGGAGEGTGTAGGFGSRGAVAGALRGKLYDFKQDPRGKPHSGMPVGVWEVREDDAYFDTIANLQRRNFSDASLSRYFTAPHELSLTHLAIPFSPAAEGPKYFGAEDHMQPSSWIARYRGTVAFPEAGRYRFAGVADDFMGIYLDGKTRFLSTWPDLNPVVAGRWKHGKGTDRWATPYGEQKLDFGEWFEVRAGEEIEMDLVIGERPGGSVGFLLLLEKEGESYRLAADGRPILPLFATAPFSDQAREEVVRQFPNFEFEWDNVPVVRVK